MGHGGTTEHDFPLPPFWKRPFDYLNTTTFRFDVNDPVRIRLQ